MTVAWPALVALWAVAATAPLLAASEEIEAVDLGGVRPETSALLLSGGEGGDLRMAVFAMPIGPPRDGKSEVLVVTEIEGASLLAGSADGALGIEISTFAVAAGGAVADFIAEGVRLELPRDRAAIAAGGLRYVTSVKAQAGALSIRVLARQRRTGAFGIRRADLEVAPGQKAPLAPQIPALENTWLDARSPRLATLPPALPSALPVLGAAALRLWVPLPAGLQVGAMTLRLAADGGGIARDVPASLVERRSGASGAYDVAVLEWTPPQLPRGAYLLSFATRPAEGKGLESPPTRMLSPGGEPAKLWTELDIGRAEKLIALPAAPRAARADKHELEEYRAALARLAAGDRASALSAVAALEVRVLTTRKHFEDLREIERKLLLGLAERDAEALLPVALLHQELLRRYLSEGKPGLPSHALQTTLWIAERYAERGSEEAQRAAQVVISLAGSAIDAGAPRRGAELFSRASVMDPSNELARLGRAAVLTRIGDLLGARSELARLLELRPGHREARLRLALLSLRAGNEGWADRDLRALVAGDPPADWVTALAYQELARMLLRDKHAQAARELLTEAARRLPDDPGVLIALSYARELSGDRAGAQAELTRRAALAGGAESARRRFSRWPDETLRAARRSFQEDALLRLPLLAAALGKAPIAT